MSQGGAAVLVGSLLAVSALGVARTQPRLAHTAHEVKETDDVYAFPPPAQLKAVVLGYDAAAVDLLWAKLLVEFGVHWHEKRSFHPDPYVDAIVYLEPSYDRIYRFVDTLLCYHPLHATADDARKTRAILEQGTRNRPWDFEVWQELGQFSAFLGPGFLPSDDDAEKDRWRHDGALAMMKAVDLGGPASGALIAATMLDRSGEPKAAIEALKRSYAYIDDPDERAAIAAKLARLKASEGFAAEQKAMAQIGTLRTEDWPFLTTVELLLIGPFPDPARCAGPAAADDPDCTRDWDTLLANPMAPPP
jgi:hypothetical protein